jgi:putative addiction module component (TIGR02574 family)
MSDSAKTLAKQVRDLPPEDRITLIEEVLDSLDRADPEIDRLWAHEASERLAAYHRGELAAKDLSEVIAKYRP